VKGGITVTKVTDVSSTRLFNESVAAPGKLVKID